MDGLNDGEEFDGKFCDECAYQLALYACENNTVYSRKPLEQPNP